MTGQDNYYGVASFALLDVASMWSVYCAMESCIITV